MMPSSLGRRLSSSERAMRLIEPAGQPGTPGCAPDRLLPFTQLLCAGADCRKYRAWHAAPCDRRRSIWKTGSPRRSPYRRIDYALGRRNPAQKPPPGQGLLGHPCPRPVQVPDRVMDGVALLAGRDDAAHWCRLLREAALADEKGEQLEGALQRPCAPSRGSPETGACKLNFPSATGRDRNSRKPDFVIDSDAPTDPPSVTS